MRQRIITIKINDLKQKLICQAIFLYTFLFAPLVFYFIPFFFYIDTNFILIFLEVYNSKLNLQVFKNTDKVEQIDGFLSILVHELNCDN